MGADVFPLSWKDLAAVPTTTRVGYAISLMNKYVFSVSEYLDALVFGGGFGKGQGYRIIALSWDGKASGVITPTGLGLSSAWFFYVGYSHCWHEHLNSTISTHWAGTNLSAFHSDNTIMRAGSFQANLIWFPYRLGSTGLEYMWGMREDKDGSKGTASRIQFMAKSKFN